MRIMIRGEWQSLNTAVSLSREEERELVDAVELILKKHWRRN